MFFKDDKNRPLILLLITVVLVMLMSYIPKDFSVAGYTFKPIDLFIDVRPDSFFEEEASGSELNALPADKYEVLTASVDYTMLFESLESYSSLFNDAFPNTSAAVDIGKKVPLSGNVSQMKYFYDALKNSKSQKLRVADYGDSGNEGDLITSDIRAELQKQFGGQGVGFMNITAQDITFRMTTKHSFSGWKTVSVLGSKDRNVPFGMNGFVAIPEKAGAWVKYEAQDITPSSKSFKLARLFYANAKASTIKYSFDNGKEETAALETGSGVKELVLDPGKEVRSLKITAGAPAQAHFFGVSLESGNGVYVDNFAWRGNTGLSFKDIPDDYQKDFNRLMNYKLIILTYGANMLAAGNVNFNSYRSQMTKVIKDLQTNFPNTSILMVGLGDKSIKRGSRFVTDPDVHKMIETQQKIVEETGITFWNKFEAMGGENSMVNWVNNNPPYASKDYGHLTYDGAKYLGKTISRVLIESMKK